ncbi:MAG: hypothetical protein IV093_08510 [Rubrivivax sp.]|nr:hypothetical protein [Rubrivivax sp.]
MLARMVCLFSRALAVLLALALSGCATVALPPEVPPDLLPDAQFGPPGVLVDADAALAVSPAMHQFLRDRVKPLARLLGEREALTMALFQRGKLLLDYDDSRTRTAAEAFETRSGNCLSLVLLTAALAQQLDLHVRYQQVHSEASWSRSGDLLAYSGHVNLVLGGGGAWRRAGGRWDTQLVIDFLPPQDLMGQRSSVIDENTLLGMFLNNRAAEALAAGRLDDADAHVRAALQRAPRLVAAWNTLALLHRRRGDDRRATGAWQQALAAEPDNTRVLANLVDLYSATGRPEAAAPLRARLLQLEPVAPFEWTRRGQAALAEGRHALAREAFLQELARDPFQHEAHAGMAQAEAGLGHLAAVRRHLALARDASPTLQQRALYGAKLDRLAALQ